MPIPLLLLQAASAVAPPAVPPQLEAVRAPTPVVVDGRLDDAVWRVAPAARGWRQNDPDQGAPASVDTEARVAYDARFLYVALFARDSAGAPPPRVRNLQRDFRFDENDAVAVVLDPFQDQRSAQVFQVTAAGNQRDAQFLVGVGLDQDWDVPWRSRTARTDSGWTAELAIPWSSLRYPDGAGTWRVNFYRGLRRRNEFSVWSLVPRGLSLARTDYAGLLTGIAPPRAGTPLQLQPYVRSRAGRFGATGGPFGSSAIGGEIKWQPTAGTIVDLTVNTDFAQAEVDRQVVNLTRFSPFFPERRQFFLENRALFSAGVAGRIEPFFSRSIGRGADGVPVPVQVGGRLIRRSAAASTGVLLLRQGRSADIAHSDIAVARATRNLGTQARVGAMLVGRRDASATGPPGWHGTMVVDGFRQLGTTAGVSTVLSATRRTRAGGDGLAGAVVLTQGTPRVFGELGAEVVTAGYEPDVGFVARQDYARVGGQAFLDLRPAFLPPRLRSLQPSIAGEVVALASTRTLQEARLALTPFAIGWQSGAYAEAGVELEMQQLDEPFAVVPGLALPAGRTATARALASLGSDPAGALAWRADASAGGYFDGTLRRLDGALRWTPDPRVAINLAYTHTEFRGVGIGASRVTTRLLAPELRLALNPRVQLTGFYQHNTAIRQGNLNARFSWELAPLSFLYVIWNSRRAIPGIEGARAVPAGDQVTVKLAYLFRRG